MKIKRSCKASTTVDGAKKSKRRRKSKKSSSVALYIATAVFGAVFLFSGYKIVSTLVEYRQAANEFDGLKASYITEGGKTESGETGYLKIDEAALTARNSDYIGWIDIPNTKISYPVLYAYDYYQYLRTSFDGEYSICGSLFTDYQCEKDWSSRNTIIYGHRMNDGSMFGTLKNYLGQSYFDAHSEIRIYDGDFIAIYQPFAAYEAIAGDRSYTVNFSDDDSFIDWAQYVKGQSIVSSDVTIEGDDKVILLSTCKGGDNNDRIVVVAVLTGYESVKEKV